MSYTYYIHYHHSYNIVITTCVRGNREPRVIKTFFYYTSSLIIIVHLARTSSIWHLLKLCRLVQSRTGEISEMRVLKIDPRYDFPTDQGDTFLRPSAIESRHEMSTNVMLEYYILFSWRPIIDFTTLVAAAGASIAFQILKHLTDRNQTLRRKFPNEKSTERTSAVAPNEV